MTKAYGFESTAEEVAQGLDLTGETIVVTGGSAGLGIETMRVLSMRGAKVVSVVRDSEKGKGAIEGIRKTVPDANIELAELDLSDLDSVRRGGDQIAKRFPRSTDSSTTPESWPVPSAERPRASSCNWARIISVISF